MASVIPIDNSYATSLQQLHTPGNPVVFANIYDPASAAALLSLSSAKAVATASYAIAASLGVADEDLSSEQNLAAIARIAPLVRAAGLPLSADLQDGYGAQLVEVIQKAIALGVVGANIEDSYPEKGHARGMECLRSIDEQVQRIKLAKATAEAAGVKDFVINARTDMLKLDPPPKGWSEAMVLEEAVKRGKAYLEAGATCVFVWGGGQRGVSRSEVEILVRELNGRVAVKLAEDEKGLSVNDLAAIGVCRISVGPSLWKEAMNAVKKSAERILNGGQLWAGLAA
ncbi:phosphoenolpyruvate phosphomutase-domain-containing protein [Lyophyllum atratum]|nr:phosphoenolpyruvate phosphomutase-domain-containing protein [Lyophyllum atratum]